MGERAMLVVLASRQGCSGAGRGGLPVHPLQVWQAEIPGPVWVGPQPPAQGPQGQLPVEWEQVGWTPRSEGGDAVWEMRRTLRRNGWPS